jgi:hypothetical protein
MSPGPEGPQAAHDHSSIRWLDSHRLLLASRTPEIFANQTAVELARITAGRGRIGVVTRLWQWAETDSPEVSYAAGCGSHFDPCALWRYGITVRYHLRLYQCNESNPGQWWRGDDDAIPGFPYPGLPILDDLTYPWGSPDDMYIVVDEGMSLRLFAELVDIKKDPTGPILMATQPLANLSGVGGKLSGYTLPASTHEALRIVRGVK